MNQNQHKNIKQFLAKELDSYDRGYMPDRGFFPVAIASKESDGLTFEELSSLSDRDGIERYKKRNVRLLMDSSGAITTEVAHEFFIPSHVADSAYRESRHMPVTIIDQYGQADLAVYNYDTAGGAIEMKIPLATRGQATATRSLTLDRISGPADLDSVPDVLKKCVIIWAYGLSPVVYRVPRQSFTRSQTTFSVIPAFYHRMHTGYVGSINTESLSRLSAHLQQHIVVQDSLADLVSDSHTARRFADIESDMMMMTQLRRYRTPSETSRLSRMRLSDLYMREFQESWINAVSMALYYWIQISEHALTSSLTNDRDKFGLFRSNMVQIENRMTSPMLTSLIDSLFARFSLEHVQTFMKSVANRNLFTFYTSDHAVADLRKALRT